MTALRLLLKFMLCMGLILNGSGHALAGGHAMAHAHSTQTAAMPAAHGMGSGCNESMTDHQATPGTDTIAHNQACPDTDSGPSDCCQSASACGSACEQHSPATVSAPTMANACTGDTQVLPPSRAGHASPPPPRLIRPPIA